MTIYYADFDLATGNNDGSTAADAWQTMQRAVDGIDGVQPAAGDIVRCQGTDTLVANLDIDGLSGDTTSGMVRFIGMSDISAGTIDGTRAVLDGDSQTYTCTGATADFINFENFEFKQMSGAGLGSASVASDWKFNNCSFNNNSGRGAEPTNMTNSFFFRCTFYLNGTDGAFRGNDTLFILCSFHDNTDSGYQDSVRQIYSIGCLYYDNGNDGWENIYQNSLMLNCVVNDNTDDGILISGIGVPNIIGCRITNHSGAGDIGLNANNNPVFHGWNYYENNDGANIQNGSLAIEILDAGATTDAEDQSDTNQGYTDKTDGAEDFNLRSDATSRRTAITIPTV